MRRPVKNSGKMPERETLTEAYAVRVFRNEPEEPRVLEADLPEVQHADPGAVEAIKKMIKGHGKQTVLPDDCQFGDNELCYVDT